MENVTELQQEIQNLKSLVEQQASVINEIQDSFRKLKEEYERHRHNIKDGTQYIESDIRILESEPIYIGRGGIAQITTNNGLPSQQDAMIIAVGPDVGGVGSGQYEETRNVQFLINNGVNDNTNRFHFVRAFGPNFYSGLFDSTSGSSTITDPTFNWETNQLQNQYVSVLTNSGVLINTYRITSNTATTITISGTLSTTETNIRYRVFTPVLLGSADAQWRRLYVGGDFLRDIDGNVIDKYRAIQMGIGPTSGAGVISIFYGSGTPEGSVTANVGSLFLRTDGSTTTTLYVKTSGTGNTGWTPK